MPYEAFPNQERRNFLQTYLEIPALLRALPVPRGSALLEIGCGRGVGLSRFAELCEPSHLAGIDIDPTLIRIARDRLAGLDTLVELVEGDARALPFEDAEFDVVVDFGTCYHIDHPELALSEVARVLRPGGVFIHETRLAQLLAHPIRATRRQLPWHRVPELTAERSAILWTRRRRVRVARLEQMEGGIHAAAHA